MHMKQKCLTALMWLGRIVLLIVCSAVIGTILLVLVALIPEEAMYDNVVSSAEVLYEEGTYPKALEGIAGTWLDNFTDGLIINTAYTRSGDLLGDALLGTRIQTGDYNPMESLYNFLVAGTEDAEIITYGRYWHGYMVVLCPLLVCISYSSIRSLNMVCQLAAMFVLFALLIKNKREELCLPLFVMYVLLSPITLFYSLQYSPVFYATVLTCIILVWKHNKLDTMNRCIIFALDGIFVAYFDLLTYPLVALGVPLILYLSLESNKESSIKQNLFWLLAFSASWLIGYAGMWASKWVIANVLTEENVISSAISAANTRISRSSSGTEADTDYTLASVVLSSAEELWSASNLAIIAVAVIIFIACAVRYKCNLKSLPATIAILLVCCYPFVWYFVLMNHSGVHVRFAYRELIILIYGIASALFVQIDFGQKRARWLDKKDINRDNQDITTETGEMLPSENV